MDGFRTEMNLTLVSKINGSAQCAGEDEKENSILVSLYKIRYRYIIVSQARHSVGGKGTILGPC